jgi:hypothetical protein
MTFQNGNALPESLAHPGASAMTGRATNRPVAAVVLVLLLAGAGHARATEGTERDPAWWQSFYARVGRRDLLGLHAYAGNTIGLGYRFARGAWGVDGSILNVQYGGTHEGLETAATLLGVVDAAPLLGADVWLGLGASYGWSSGYVDTILPRRSGHGIQLEAVLGYELPRALRVPLFVQAALTAPLYRLYDVYRSTGSPVYALGIEAAAGVRF